MLSLVSRLRTVNATNSMHLLYRKLRGTWAGGERCSKRELVWVLLLVLLCVATAQAENPDTLVLANGDKLSGKLNGVAHGSVAFHDDVLGDLSIPLAKITALTTAQRFAVGKKGEELHAGKVTGEVPVGTVRVENGTLSLTPAQGDATSFPVAETRFLIPAAQFQRDLKERYDLFHGWSGSVTAGVSVVTATNSAQTYTGTAALVRSIPKASGLPPISKTSVNLSGTYGLAKDPTIISGGDVYQTASITKTDILHGDAEYDRYFSRPFFGLVNASADHNFGNGLQLQEAYGGGIGWSILRSQSNNVDIKAALQYEKQSFYNNVISGLGTPDENLVGASLSETWNHTFPHNMKFLEDVDVMPAFNVVQAGSAAATATFTFPVYKQINFNVSSTDNYLGDPPLGFLRNTFQFTTGITYTIK